MNNRFSDTLSRDIKASERILKEGLGAPTHTNAVERLSPRLLDKKTDLREAAREKKISFEDYARQDAENAERLRNSVVGKLGLDPETSGLGESVDKAVRAYGAVNKGIGNVIASGFDGWKQDWADHIRKESTLTDAVYNPDAELGTYGVTVNSLIEGTGNLAKAVGQAPGAIATGLDTVDRGVRSAMEKIGLIGEGKLISPDQTFVTPADLVRSISEGIEVGDRHFAGTRELGESIGSGIQGFVDEGVRKEFEKIAGAEASAIDNALNGDFDELSDIITDPKAWGYTLGQAIPSLAAAALGGARTVAALEAGSAEDAIREFEKETGIKVDSVDAAKAIAQQTLVNTALEMFGLGQVSNALSKMAKEKLQASFMKSLAAKGGATVLAGGSEAVTEGLQAINENMAAKLNYDEERNPLHGAVLAAMGGKATGSGAPIAGSVYNAGQQRALRRSEYQQEKGEKDADLQMVTDARTGGDPTPFLDAESRHYNPREGFSIIDAALKKEGATEEQRNTLLTQADKALAHEEAILKELEEDAQMMSPEGLKQIEQDIAALKEKRETAPEERKEVFDSVIASQQDILDNAPDYAAEANAAYKNKEQEVNRLRAIREQMGAATYGKATPEEVQDLVKKVESVPTTDATPEQIKEGTDAAQNLVVLAMASTGNVDTATLSTLSRNPNIQLSKEHKRFLSSFEKAQSDITALRDKTPADVHSDVVQGGKDYTGLVEYRDRVAGAVSAKNTDSANKHLKDLENFNKSHQQKAKLVKQAMALVTREKNPIEAASVVRVNGQWTLKQEALSAEERKRTGGLNIHANSKDLVGIIDLEAQAIASTLEEVKAAIATIPAKPVTKAKTETEATAPAPSRAEIKRQKDVSAADATFDAAIQDIRPKSQTVVWGLENKINLTPKENRKLKTHRDRVSHYNEVIARAKEDGKISVDDRTTLVNLVGEQATETIETGLANREKAKEYARVEKATTEIKSASRKATAANTSLNNKITQRVKTLKGEIAKLQGKKGELSREEQKRVTTLSNAVNQLVSAANFITGDQKLSQAKANFLNSQLGEGTVGEITTARKTYQEAVKVATTERVTVPEIKANEVKGLEESPAPSKNKVGTPKGVTTAPGNTSDAKGDESTTVVQTEAPASPHDTQDAYVKATVDIQRKLDEVHAREDRSSKDDRLISSLEEDLEIIAEASDPEGFQGTEAERYSLLADARRIVRQTSERGAVPRDNRPQSYKSDVEEVHSERLDRLAYLEQIPKSGLTRELRNELKELQTLRSAIESIPALIEKKDKLTRTEMSDFAKALGQRELRYLHYERSAYQNVMPGGLSIMSQVSPEGTPYNERNLIADFLKQSAGKAKTTTKKPLVMVRNFLSNWGEVTVGDKGIGPHDYLDREQPLSPEETRALQHYRETVQKWNEIVAGDLQVRGGATGKFFRHKDPSQFLLTLSEIDGTPLPEMEENVLTAISTAAYTWTIESSGRSLYNDSRGINSLLGRDQSASVSPAEYKYFSDVGTHYTTLSNQLGRAAVDALGLEAKSDEAYRNILPSLRASLGAHALALLLDDRVGVLEGVQIPAAQWNKFAAPQYRIKERAVQNMARTRRANPKELTPAQAVTDITEANRGSKGVVQDLIGVTQARQFPSLEPQEFTQEFTNMGHARVPEELANILNETQKEKQFADKEKQSVASSMRREDFLAMAGWVDLSKVHMQEMRRIKQEAVNKGLERDYDNWMEFVETHLSSQEEGLDSPFFFKYKVWDQLRVGIEGSLVNPQTSKIVREMVYMDRWKTTVDPLDSDQMDNFYRRVGESMGITGSPDSRSQVENILEKDAVILAGVEALAHHLESGKDHMDVNDSAAIRDAVARMGEGMLSFSGLTALAQLHNSYQNPGYRNEGDKVKRPMPFQTTLAGEIDGTTNGVILSDLLFGAAASVEDLITKLERGGLFTGENPPESFHQWKERGNSEDRYQELARTLAEFTRKLVGNNKKVADSVWYFTGELFDDVHDKATIEGRNFVKKPLLSSYYGSSVFSSVSDMGRELVNEITKTIEESVMGNGDMDSTVKHINNLLKLGGAKKDSLLSTNITPEELMALEFTKVQEAAIVQAFSDAFTDPIQNSLTTLAGYFQHSSNVMNTAAANLFGLYDAVETSRLDQARKEEGNNLHDISIAREREIKKELAPLLPNINTDYTNGAESGEAGIYAGKASTASSNSEVYRSEVGFKNPIGNTDSKRIGVSAEVPVNAPPGARPLVVDVHGADSATSHKSLQRTGNSRNLHDAQQTGLDTFYEVGQSLNQEFLTVALNHSPMRETLNAYRRTLDTYLKEIATKPLTKTGLQKLSEQVKGGGKRKVPAMRDVFDALKKEYYRSEEIRLEYLSNVTLVDQYSAIGAGYAVPESFREEARKRLEALREERAQLPQDAKGRILSEEEHRMINTLEAQASLIGEKINTSGVANPPVSRIVEMARETKQGMAFYEEARAMSPDALYKDLTQLYERHDKWNKTDRLKYNTYHEVYNAKVNDPANMELTPIIESVDDVQGSTDAPDSSLTPPTAPTRETPWGPEGPTIHGIDPEWKAYFDGNSDAVTGKVNVTGNAFVQAVRSRLGRGTSTSSKEAFMHQFLDKMAKNGMLSDNLDVYYISPETAVESVPGGAQKTASGWYIPQTEGNKAQIVILGDQFTHANVTSELLVHELMHHALYNAIENPTPETQVFVDDLQAILSEAKKVVAQSPELAQKYGPAVENVHELVAWGITDAGFIRDVLNNVTYNPSKAKRKAEKSLIKKFFDSVMGLLFGKAKARSVGLDNGLRGFVTDIAGLIEYNKTEAQAMPQPTEQTILFQRSTDRINSMTTGQLFDTLSGSDAISPVFNEHLRDVLGKISSRLHGPFGQAYSQAKKHQALTPNDVYAKAVDTGDMPFASSASLSGLKMTERELYVLEQVEVTARAALDNPSAPTTQAYKQLERIYNEAAKQLKSHVAPDGLIDQATYDFIFQLDDQGEGRLDHLSRFAAMSIAHEGLNTLLEDVSVTPEAVTNEGLNTRIKNWFERQVNSVISNEEMDTETKVTTLLDKLVDIEAKRRAKLVYPETDLFSPLEGVGEKVAGAARKGATSIAKSSFVQGSKSKVLSATGKVVELAAEGRLGELVAGLNAVQNYRDQNLHGDFLNTVNYMRGHPGDAIELLQEGKRIESVRQDEIAGVAKFVLDSFENGGANITEAQSAGVSNVFLRSNAHALLDTHSFTEVGEFVTNNEKRAKRIRHLESQLDTFQEDRGYYSKQAKALGYKLVHGNSTLAMIGLSTENIANMIHSPRAFKVPERQVRQAHTILEELVPLYAIEYSNESDRISAAELLHSENNRTDGGNGIVFVLKAHKELLSRSKDSIFEGEEIFARTGYLTEIFNPYDDIVITNAEEGAELELRGYAKETYVGHDSRDPDAGNLYIYRLVGGGKLSRATGIVSPSDIHAKGSRAAGNLDPNAVHRSPAHRRKAREMMQHDPNFDPRKVRENFMVPLVNLNGEVVGYRYEASARIRDNIMERDNRFEHSLGLMAGQTLDRVKSKEHNKKVVQAMKDIYDSQYSTDPSGFILVGPNSTDPKVKEAYQLMPDQMKKDIQEVWGGKGMYLKKELFNLTFGYRKASLSTMFEKAAEDRNFVESAAVAVTEYLLETYALLKKGMNEEDAKRFAKRAGIIIRRGEDAWQEIVRELKDIIVIRSGILAIANFVSNASVLWISGVPFKQALRDQMEAYVGGRNFFRDSDKLRRLEMQVSMGTLQGRDLAEMQREITILKDRIEKNPVTPFIRKGMMPTIVHDMSFEDDKYSYKSRFRKKVESTTERLPSGVKELGRVIALPKDTAYHKGMTEFTQLSDFVARYSLHKHLVSRKKNPLSGAEARKVATDAFVAYDVPLPKTLQYLDDMFLFPFAKYTLSIQRVLARMLRDHPVRSITSIMGHDLLGIFPTVFASSYLGRLGSNPFSAGIFNAFGAIGQLPLVNLFFGLVK